MEIFLRNRALLNYFYGYRCSSKNKVRTEKEEEESVKNQLIFITQ